MAIETHHKLESAGRWIRKQSPSFPISSKMKEPSFLKTFSSLGSCLGQFFLPLPDPPLHRPGPFVNVLAHIVLL